MLSETLATIEAVPFIAALRNSVWTYPLVNAAHILGIALLFGSIVPLDLRLLGLWGSADASMLSRVLVPTAMAGLVIAAGAGLLLFATDATGYAESRFFQAKMVLVVLAVANALWLRRRHGSFIDISRRPARALRIAAAASVALWLTVIVLGRLVGYF